MLHIICSDLIKLSPSPAYVAQRAGESAKLRTLLECKLPLVSCRRTKPVWVARSLSVLAGRPISLVWLAIGTFKHIIRVMLLRTNEGKPQLAQRPYSSSCFGAHASSQNLLEVKIYENSTSIRLMITCVAIMRAAP